jgi:hypothetical protein
MFSSTWDQFWTFSVGASAFLPKFSHYCLHFFQETFHVNITEMLNIFYNLQLNTLTSKTFHMNYRWSIKNIDNQILKNSRITSRKVSILLKWKIFYSSSSNYYFKLYPACSVQNKNTHSKGKLNVSALKKLHLLVIVWSPQL